MSLRRQKVELEVYSAAAANSTGTAEIMTTACASGESSVIVRLICGTIPSGMSDSNCSFAPPVSAIVGLPDLRFTTPRSRQKTPCRKPVPNAFEQASFAAKRLA